MWFGGLVFNDCVGQFQFAQNSPLLFLVVELQDEIGFLFSLVDEEVGTLALPTPVLATETVNLDIVGIELSNPLVIELYPLVLTFANVAEVVSEIGGSIVQDNPLEFVSELFVLFGETFLLGQGVIVHVEFVGEFPP